MSNVTFDGDDFRPQNTSSAPRSGSGIPNAFNNTNQRGMTGWLMKKGWADSPAGAQGIMLALVGVNIIVTIIVLKYYI
jgi:hypothetical protein